MNPKFFKAGFERFEQVMTGVPDRVPVTAQMHEFSMAWTGRRAGEFYTDPNILVEGIMDPCILHCIAFSMHISYV